MSFFKQSPNVITRREGGSMLAFEQSSGRICVLNPTSEFIWEHCTGESSVDQIADRLGREFDLSSLPQEGESLIEVVNRHLDLMHKAKLIELVEAQHPTPA